MSETFRTLPGLLKYVEVNQKNAISLGYKKDDAWVGFSTTEVADTVRKLGLGLVELGLKPGDKVGVVADPSPFWIMMDLAILGAGAVSVPMFANISHDNLIYEIEDSGMRFLFVGSDPQYQAMKPFFGKLEKIITMAPLSATPDGLADGQCVSYQNLQDMGAKRHAKNPGEYMRLSEGINEQDTATLIYTSGSTGVPKGVELTHRNLVFQVLAAHKRFPLDPATDKILSCLPLAHVFERMVTYYYFFTGTSIYFAEEIKKVAENLRELHPTVITLVPRLLEKVHAKMQANVELAQGFKKTLGTKAWNRAHSKIPGSRETFMDKIYDALVYKKMRAALGGNLRIAISGSAPLDPGLASFLINIGIPIYEGYGLTEASPVISCNFPGHRKIGTIGLAFPGVEVKFGDDGEILTRGPHVMKGYYNKPVETAEVIDKMGWLHTGDLGHFDAENYIKITGRKKELFKTANGKYVAPVPIEQAISANKLVDMVMVVAEGKPYTTCLIFPDFENMKAVKAELNLESAGNDLFLDGKEAKAYIQKTIDEVNVKLNHWEQIQKFAIIKTPITVDSGQLTPTMKIRRHIVMEKYRTEIDSMYRS
ncbi:MAG: long-chain fatty acid--CoA ligase [Fibrobacterota bacterium]|nr:long-chain fatty acid--CoA ligase [Fibrobacterota bacterium]